MRAIAGGVAGVGDMAVGGAGQAALEEEVVGGGRADTLLVARM